MINKKNIKEEHEIFFCDFCKKIAFEKCIKFDYEKGSYQKKLGENIICDDCYYEYCEKITKECKHEIFGRITNDDDCFYIYCGKPYCWYRKAIWTKELIKNKIIAKEIWNMLFINNKGFDEDITEYEKD